MTNCCLLFTIMNFTIRKSFFFDIVNRIIIFLGENYDLIAENRFLIYTILIFFVLASFQLIRKSSWRTVYKILVFLVVVMCAVVVLLATAYVSNRVSEIIIPQSYSMEEFSTLSSGSELSGLRIYPKSGGANTSVIFVVGSSVSSYRTNYSKFSNQVLIPFIASQGYEIVFYDKPGVGKSTGDWIMETIPQEANHLIDLANYLKKGNKNLENIGIIGHSHGGYVVQTAAALSESFQFAISMAGSTQGFADQIFQDEFSELRCDGTDSLTAEKKVTKIIEEIESKSVDSSSGPYYNYKINKDFDPITYLMRIKVPLLLIFAEYDTKVWLDENIKNLNKIEGNKYVHTETIPGVSHSFRESSGYCFETSKSKYSGKLIQEVLEWLASLEENTVQGVEFEANSSL